MDIRPWRNLHLDYDQSNRQQAHKRLYCNQFFLCGVFCTLWQDFEKAVWSKFEQEISFLLTKSFQSTERNPPCLLCNPPWSATLSVSNVFTKLDFWVCRLKVPADQGERWLKVPPGFLVHNFYSPPKSLKNGRNWLDIYFPLQRICHKLGYLARTPFYCVQHKIILLSRFKGRSYSRAAQRKKRN